MSQTKRVPKRSEVPVEDTWRLEDIYATPADWEKEAAALAELPAEIAKFAGHLGDDAATLLRWMRTSDEVRTRLSRLYGYAAQMSGSGSAVFGIFIKD